jgi:hypothetical protein
MNLMTTAKGVGTVFTGNEPDNARAVSTSDAMGGNVLLARRSSPPPWLEGCLARIRRLGTLRANWDSYGALPVDPSSADMAAEVLRALAMVETVEEPTVTATPAGNAALCWDDGQRSLDVEVRPDGVLEYSYLNESRAIPDEENLTDDIGQLAVLLTQF